MLRESPETPGPNLKKSSHPARQPAAPTGARGHNFATKGSELPGSERPRAPGPGGSRTGACSRATLPAPQAPTQLAAVAIGCIGDRPSSLLLSGPCSVRA